MYLNLPEGKIALDTSDKNANINFVSHAHTDHIKGAIKGAKNKEEIIASEETKRLIEARENIELRLMEHHFKLLDSGHILGSKQLFIDSELGYSILYTGDYQLQESCAAKKIEPKKADILIIDSTYPYLDLKFDDREEVEGAIKRYVETKLEKGIILFSAYPLGKAQELIKIINSIGVTPVVDKKIGQLNKVYNEFGVGLEYASLYEDEEYFNEVTKRNFVGIVSKRDIRELAANISRAYNKKVFTAIATGFAKLFRFDTDVQFALSDHADIYQASEYIEMCGADIIYTYGGNAKLMASNLAKLGYNALPFNEANWLAVEKNIETIRQR